MWGTLDGLIKFVCCQLKAWGALVVWKMPLEQLPKPSLKLAFQSPLTVGTWLTIVVTVLGVGYAVLTPKPSQSSDLKPSPAKVSILELTKSGRCQTLVTDPNPPLNIRSSPVSAKDNIVGNLKNGTLVTVINENQGWVQISQPLRGWIYENLTVTTCTADPNKTSANPEAGPVAGPIATLNVPNSAIEVLALTPEESSKSVLMTGDALVTAAQQRFHGGDLQGAIEKLRQVSAEDSSHTEASLLLKTMPEQWQSATKTYHKAEVAIQRHQFQTVLALVSEMPDIRHWRAKMTPLVKLAIAHQNSGS